MFSQKQSWQTLARKKNFDDGQRERVDLHDETVRIMTKTVTICRCRDSPGGKQGCCQGTGGSKSVPRPWESNPK
tara:strand:+ start:162 stop:383 length:222 start_codon:yes stop_codon:yes gene_type:complete